MSEPSELKRIFHLQSVLAGLVMLALPFPPAIAAAQVLVAQLAQSVPADSPLVFDVVSIKRNNSGNRNINIYSPTNGDGMNLTNVLLSDIVAYAYGVQSVDLLQGLPVWAKSDRYDIQAKVVGPEVARFSTKRSENE